MIGRLNLTTSTRGPSLKNSLVGAAAHYKGILENRLLADADDGVDYTSVLHQGQPTCFFESIPSSK